MTEVSQQVAELRARIERLKSDVFILAPRQTQAVLGTNGDYRQQAQNTGPEDRPHVPQSDGNDLGEDRKAYLGNEIAKLSEDEAKTALLVCPVSPSRCDVSFMQPSLERILPSEPHSRLSP